MHGTGTPSTEQSDRFVRYRWWGLLAISLGVALIIMDSTIVSVAVPAIVADLGISSTEIQWVQEIYTLLFAALLLTWGRLADRFGRRRIMFLGVVIFVAASVLCAVAGSGAVLITGRALQGLGGSMILPTTLALLNANFHGRERAIAFAVWGSTIGGMAAFGPLAGGWLIENASWRWAFGINVPFGVLILAGLLLFVAESRETRAVPGTDAGGALLSIVGFGALVFGLIEGRNYGWWGAEAEAPFELGGLSPVPFAFAVAVVALAGFLLWERARARAGKGVILDLSLFRIPSFASGNVTAPVLFVYGTGVGLATAQLTSVVLADVPVERSGQGSATQSTARQTGSALGIAVLGTAFFTTLRTGTEDRVADAVAADPAVQQLVDSVTASSGGSIAALAADPRTAFVADAARAAMTDGAALAAWVAAGALVVGLLSSLRIRAAAGEPATAPGASAAGAG